MQRLKKEIDRLASLYQVDGLKVYGVTGNQTEAMRKKVKEIGVKMIVKPVSLDLLRSVIIGV